MNSLVVGRPFDEPELAEERKLGQEDVEASKAFELRDLQSADGIERRTADQPAEHAGLEPLDMGQRSRDGIAKDGFVAHELVRAPGHVHLGKAHGGFRPPRRRRDEIGHAGRRDLIVMLLKDEEGAAADPHGPIEVARPAATRRLYVKPKARVLQERLGRLDARVARPVDGDQDVKTGVCLGPQTLQRGGEILVAPNAGTPMETSGPSISAAPTMPGAAQIRRSMAPWSACPGPRCGIGLR